MAVERGGLSKGHAMAQGMKGTRNVIHTCLNNAGGQPEPASFLCTVNSPIASATQIAFPENLFFLHKAGWTSAYVSQEIHFHAHVPRVIDNLDFFFFFF